MATSLYADFLPEVAPHIPGAPDAVTTAYVRKIVIDLCERAKVWRVTGTPVVIVAGTASGYALASGVIETVVTSLISAQLSKTLAATTCDLKIVTSAEAYRQFPDWPNSADPGEPVRLFQDDPLTFCVAPVPNTADTYTVIPRVSIKPTFTSTGWDSVLFDLFRRVVFHGVLYEMMLMKGRKWSDPKTALIHGKQWQYLVQEARARVNKSFGRSDVAVQMVPWG